MTFSEIAGWKFEDTMTWDDDAADGAACGAAGGAGAAGARLRITKLNREKGYEIVGWRAFKPGGGGRPDAIEFQQLVRLLDGSKEATAVQFFERVVA